MSGPKVFTIEGEELDKARQWEREHPCREREMPPVSFERFVYCFMPTGLGVFATIKCRDCGQEYAVTDCSKW